MIVLESSVQHWVVAYQEYRRASQVADVGSRYSAAHAVATASWAVASAWRELAAAPGLPWWVLAAVNTSARVFEEQAREWAAHAKQLGNA